MNRGNIHTTLIILLVVFTQNLFSQTAKENLKYVNPFVGTASTSVRSEWGGYGGTYPGAVAPFGFIHLTPETRMFNPKGYNYKDPSIFYFSCINHHSGYPQGSAGNIMIMPVEDSDNFQPREYQRYFLHENEKAEPGYYSVYFNDNATLVETTASERTGMFRFTFKSNVEPVIYIGDIGKIASDSGRIFRGSRYHTIIEFNEACIIRKDIRNGCILKFTPSFSGEKVLLLKLSTSTVGYESTRRNLDVENPGWDLDRLKEETQKNWNQELSVIEVNDTSTVNKRKFYTALYHSLLIPWVISDVDGYYKGRDGSVHKANGNDQYDAFSPWDTFRSLHSLLCLIAPERQLDMIRSVLHIYKQTGHLPKGPMTGNHVIPVIVDSYLKGITDFDKSLAYEAMKKILVNRPFSQNYIRIYDHFGYVPSSYPESVTRTVEYAYNDWALAQFSRKVMQQMEDYELLLDRSYSYRNLFHAQTLFLLPRKADEFITEPGNFGYKEGDKWIYSLFVPHNIKDLINLMGGNDAFCSHLDLAFDNHHLPFDNEPVLHIPYLYNYAGSPGKTQRRVNQIMNSHYKSTPDGLPGNDDLGSMSSWFVFSAMGFFPVCPGRPVYDIGSPLFESVTVNLKNNKKFIIKAKNLSSENIFIKSLSVNGKIYNRSWIPHALITNGGEMHFKMTAATVNHWATESDAVAPSEIKYDSDFKIMDPSITKKRVAPHELFWIHFKIMNSGAKGTKILKLFVDGEEYNRKNILVEKHSSRMDSISCRLYQTGERKLTIDDFNKYELGIQVIGNDIRDSFIFQDLVLKPVVKKGGQQHISFSVMNTGGYKDVAAFQISSEDTLIYKDSIILKPGEGEKVTHNYMVMEEGMHTIRVDGLTGKFKVYNSNIYATVLDLSLDTIKNDSIIPDHSGFGNHAIIQSSYPDMRKMSDDLINFDEYCYVSVPNSRSLDIPADSITMMAWIYPAKEHRGLVDILTKGDFNVIQQRGNRSLSFFTGGWGRGECHVSLPGDWVNRWHHVAGTCDGNMLRVFLDGELKGTCKVRKKAMVNPPAEWYLGRNEEFPSERIFHGNLDKVKILAAPLTKEEIN